MEVTTQQNDLLNHNAFEQAWKSPRLRKQNLQLLSFLFTLYIALTSDKSYEEK